MTERWARPADDGTAADRGDTPVVDVPLTGEADGAKPRDEPVLTANRRGLMTVAMLVGAVAVVAVTVVRFADDDDPNTVSPSDKRATTITTPPTLRPLDTLPRPGDPDVWGTTSAEPRDAPSTPRSVTVPTYPPADGAVLSEIVRFDVVAALDHNGEDIARRSDTRVELGSGGYVLDVSIERDPENDRYRLELATRGASETVVVDVATGTSFVQRDTGESFTIDIDDVVGPDTDAHDHFDRLLQGPFRIDTYDPVATRGRGLVTIDGIGDVREYVTFVDGELAPEWRIHAFAPVHEFRAVDLPDQLEYTVYLDDADRIVQVDGVAMLGNVPQLVRHRITELDGAPAIELPASVARSARPVG